MTDAPAPAAAALTCPSCGGTVTLRAAGYTVTVACQYCGSILDVSQPQVKVVTEWKRASERLRIPIGTRGTLRGVEWEMIGYMRRSERGAYPGEEYLLFNPYHGYRWLIYNRGGWSLGRQLNVAPTGYRAPEIDGRPMEPFFADGEAQVDDVVGEFYWRVKRGDTVRTDDWVAPGFMLSREADASEVNWSLSELLDPDEVPDAFGVERSGRIWPPLPHQPSPVLPWLKQALIVAALALGVILVAGLLTSGSTRLAAQRAPIASDGSDQQAVIGPITLTRPRQGVRVRAEVPDLSNGWVELDFALVNRADQRGYGASKTAERYSGRDSDGDWSEGSRRKSASFAAVPAGTYDLIVDYRAERWLGAQSAGDWRLDSQDPQIEFVVSRQSGSVGNVILALILIAIPVLIGVLRHASFETRRRAESDFAPTGDDEEDDD